MECSKFFFLVAHMFEKHVPVIIANPADPRRSTARSLKLRADRHFGPKKVSVVGPGSRPFTGVITPFITGRGATLYHVSIDIVIVHVALKCFKYLLGPTGTVPCGYRSFCQAYFCQRSPLPQQ